MFERKLGVVAALVLSIAAIAAACGGSQGNSNFGLGGDGGASSGGTSSGGTSSGGTSSGGTPILGGGSSSGGTSGSSSGGTAPTTCDPSCAAAGGTCANAICSINENPGGVSTGNQSTLNAPDGGASADSSFAWQYPYDKTVFPRGLLPLTLQFAGTAFDAAKVTVTFPGMNYTGFYAPGTSPNQVKFSAAAWTAITAAAQATSAVQVQVTKETGGAVSGPISETWTIAQGNIRGTIYYETYGSQLIDAGVGGGLGGLGGDDNESVGIMKIQPGATTPTVLESGCGNVCHTASANGSTLVANAGDTSSYDSTSASYNLGNNAAVLYTAQNQNLTYGGIYPDGTFVMSATNYRTWATSLTSIFTPPTSLLYSTSTGANIPATGWTVTNAGTPAFSPDGTMMAYNSGLDNNGSGGSLGVANFDKSTYTFSNLTNIATAPDTTNATLAWPAFTPDTKNVLYHAGSNAAFETDSDATGDLYIVDLATKTSTRLDAADGYSAAAPSTTSYLPANDPDMNFAPTVLPEAVGGYFWAVFTSHRSYGNTTPSKDNNDQNGKLWVTAIDLNPTAGQDPSHPAFFLDGQELTSDNLRGFWVLNPCQANGASCTSGDDCCGGFCVANGDGGALQCSSTLPSGGCSQQYDKCTTASDCCDTTEECINGFCALPPPK